MSNIILSLIVFLWSIVFIPLQLTTIILPKLSLLWYIIEKEEIYYRKILKNRKNDPTKNWLLDRPNMLKYKP